MERVKFLPKVLTLCFREEKRFNYKNNHGRNKSANFRLDNICKINYRTLVVFSYTYQGWGQEKSN